MNIELQIAVTLKFELELFWVQNRKSVNLYLLHSCLFLSSIFVTRFFIKGLFATRKLQ